MSMAEALRFVSDMSTDKTLADRIKTQACGLDTLVTLGRASGYDFTADELRHAVRDLRLAPSLGDAIGGSITPLIATTVTIAVETAAQSSSATQAEASQVAVAMIA